MRSTTGHTQSTTGWRVMRWTLLLALLLLATAGFDSCGEDAGEDGESTPSVAYSPPPSGAFDLRVLGRPSVESGSRAAFRLVTVDAKGQQPVPGVHTRISVARAEGERPVPVFAGYTDASGGIEADFAVPELEPGTYVATFTAAAGGQTETLVQNIQVTRRNRLYLTTDKPLYQPGQTIHLRALGLSTGSLRPLAGKPLEFVVEDGRGNKVFRQTHPLNRYGVASASFSLADEVNMGSYKIIAVTQDARAEMTVTVDRYVLPKYSVKIATDKPFYRPAETISGTIEARYLFGKPVSGGTVEIIGRTPAAGDQQFFSHTGKTDAEGLARFEARLPPFLVGHPLLKGKALLSFTVTVEDAAGHREQATHNVSAGENALSVEAFLEGGEVRNGVPNTLFVVAADGSGAPARAAVTLSFPGQPPMKAETGELGIAGFTFTGQPGMSAGELTVTTGQGETLTKKLELEQSGAQEGLTLLSDQAVYRAGERITFTVFSTQPTGTVFVDLVRDGQTVLTTTGKLEKGRAEWQYDIPVDAFGLMTANAYFLKQSLNFVRDTRRLMIQPAGDLAVSVEADQKQYKPGETARLTVRTADSDGRPAQAAVGLYIVDEAVFARMEQAPGLEKVFFLLEKEVMTPRWQVTAFVPDDLVRPMPLRPEIHRRQQEAGRVFLAALEDAPVAPPFHLSSRKESVRTHLSDLAGRLGEAIARYNRENPQPWSGDTESLLGFARLMKKDLLDPWDKPVEIRYRECWGVPAISFHSAGPDGKFATEDDLLVVDQNIFGWLFAEEGYALPEDDMGVCQHVVRRFRRTMQPAMGGRGGMAENEGAMERFAVVADQAVPAPPGAVKSLESGDGLAEVTRVREYFPETLFVEPSLITGPDGTAVQEVPIADSITTWRVLASGSDEMGRMGSYTGGLLCFQDFFIDPDLPLALTAGDEISLPVAVYNYLDESQSVRLEIKPADWFELLDEPVKTLTIASGGVTAVRFRIRAKQPGMQLIEIHGRGTKLADAVRKPIEVKPNGFAVPISVSDLLQDKAEASVGIPAEALAGGTRLWLRLYPGAMSEVIDGMDNMLRMPSGCFEQTSSASYPNILVLDYMTQTGKITPEIQMKAETLVSHGYQRLLTFEVAGGGFEWFGNEPANKVLTAYGLLQFTDMARVREVDKAMLERTRNWLLGKQEADGSWSPDAGYLHAESWGQIQGKNLLVTAYIAWALGESGYRGAGLDRALNYVRTHAKTEKDPYVLGLVANALLSVDPTDADGQAALKTLVDTASASDGGGIYWPGRATVTYARGVTADIETTGVVVLALLKSSRHHEPLRQALRWLVQNKDSYGTWHSTQGTIYVLKALLRSQLGARQTETLSVEVHLNGDKVKTLTIAPDQSDLMHQLDLGEGLAPGTHRVALSLSGGGPLTFQVAGRYYLPWAMKPPVKQPLISLDVTYDRTQLAVNETVTCTVTARLNSGKAAKMVMLDIGIPPGFSVESDGLAALLAQGVLQRFSQTPRQVLIYLDELKKDKPFTASFTMRARYPLRASIPEHEAYLYYDPDTRSTRAPQQVVVTE